MSLLQALLETQIEGAPVGQAGELIGFCLLLARVDLLGLRLDLALGAGEARLELEVGVQQLDRGVEDELLVLGVGGQGGAQTGRDAFNQHAMSVDVAGHVAGDVAKLADSDFRSGPNRRGLLVVQGVDGCAVRRPYLAVSRRNRNVAMTPMKKAT